MTNREFQIAVKQRMVELIREELSKKKNLPKEIRLDQASVIRNPAKFFDSHLSIVAANEGNIKDVYGRRLAIALTSAGIDVYALKSKAEKEVKAKIP